jgi:hypothetical protein
MDFSFYACRAAGFTSVCTPKGSFKNFIKYLCTLNSRFGAENIIGYSFYGEFMFSTVFLYFSKSSSRYSQLLQLFHFS